MRIVDARARFTGLCEAEALAGWGEDDRRYPEGFTTVGRCRRCGCSDRRPCADGGQGCSWVDETFSLCSRCAHFQGRRRFRRRRLSLAGAAALHAFWRRFRLVPLEMGPGQYGRA